MLIWPSTSLWGPLTNHEHHSFKEII